MQDLAWQRCSCGVWTNRQELIVDLDGGKCPLSCVEARLKLRYEHCR